MKVFSTSMGSLSGFQEFSCTQARDKQQDNTFLWDFLRSAVWHDHWMYHGKGDYHKATANLLLGFIWICCLHHAINASHLNSGERTKAMQLHHQPK